MSGWRDVLPVHPAAELFPMMSDAELGELGADIAKHGMTDAVAFWMSGDGEWFVLDGRNRLEAMERAGVRFEYVMRGPKLGPKLTTFSDDAGGAVPEGTLGHAGNSSFHIYGFRRESPQAGFCGAHTPRTLRSRPVILPYVLEVEGLQPPA
jgi:hypothetical protein